MTTDLSPTAPAHSAPPAEAGAGLTVRPDALLLDFGGVIFETVKRPSGPRDVATMLADVLGRAGHRLEAADLESSLRAGLVALKHWKHSMSRMQRPVELTHRSLWQDFLLADQPAAVRATAAGDGAPLMERMNPLMSDHVLRPGIVGLLQHCRAENIPVGIVSNAHSGLAHRALLRTHHLDGLIAVQLYSDEVGIRKPHPDMIRRAAAALGTTADRCWYVGDTQDRDVQAGRRAGVGAVVLTRSKHTDTPPFAVMDRADAVLDTPEGLLDLIESAAPPEAVLAVGEPATAAARSTRPRALLLDQGGVLTSSEKTPDSIAAFIAGVAGRLRSAGHAVTDADLADALQRGRAAYQASKDAVETDAVGRPIHTEVSPRVFWGEMVGRDLDAGVREWLLAEADDLSHDYARSKSRAWLREGVVELLQWCRDQDLPVAIVSNTICGRSGRGRLRDAGIGELIGVHAYSDEVGRRKPDPALVHAATDALGIDPADCWFVGDKPWRDVAAARAAGVGTAVIVRDGSPSESDLATSLAGTADRPDLVADSMTQVHAALAAAFATHP